MDKEIKQKISRLVNETRVMTIAVSDNNIPWSSPVYFVFYDNKFYFFSNEHARHIKYAKDKKLVSASIFQDSDQMDLIFGFQMSGVLEKVSKKILYLTIVKKYVTKFNFLKKIFGREIIENKHFFLEKFKSHLYCVHPDIIFLSDNSKTTGKRTQVNLKNLSN